MLPIIRARIQGLKDRRNSYFLGAVFIGLGLASFLALFFNWAWAAFLILMGCAFLAGAYLWRRGSFASIGSLALALGGIGWFQVITGQPQSWEYLWPLVFAAAGAGMILASGLEARTGSSQGRYRRVGWSFLVLGLVTTVGSWFVRDGLSWPVIIWGSGALLLATAIYSRVSPLVIPGVLFYGSGIVLAWFQFTGLWNRWYAWLLVPAFFGFGLGVAFLRNRVIRRLAFWIMVWSLALFGLCTLLFANQGQYLKYWPFLLIIAGLALLIRLGFFRRATRS